MIKFVIILLVFSIIQLVYSSSIFAKNSHYTIKYEDISKKVILYNTYYYKLIYYSIIVKYFICTSLH